MLPSKCSSKIFSNLESFMSSPSEDASSSSVLSKCGAQICKGVKSSVSPSPSSIKMESYGGLLFVEVADVDPKDFILLDCLVGSFFLAFYDPLKSFLGNFALSFSNDC